MSDLAHLVDDKDLIVDVDGKVVRLHDEVILWIRVCRHGHLCGGCWVGLVFLDLLWDLSAYLYRKECIVTNP